MWHVRFLLKIIISSRPIYFSLNKSILVKGWNFFPFYKGDAFFLFRIFSNPFDESIPGVPIILKSATVTSSKMMQCKKRCETCKDNKDVNTVCTHGQRFTHSHSHMTDFYGFPDDLACLAPSVKPISEFIDMLSSPFLRCLSALLCAGC